VKYSITTEPKPKAKKLNLLFDLDGTITDSKMGVVHSIQYALNQLGRPNVSSKDLDWCIGPPLAESFARLLGDEFDHLSAEAMGYYKTRYENVGLFEILPYEEIEDCLRELNELAVLYVATSNLTRFSKKILSRFSLDRYFKGIYGCQDFTKAGKGELIGNLLRLEKLNPETVIMIGDREHDIRGARENKIESLGVLWGYGTEEELLKAGAGKVLRRPEELPRFFQDRISRSGECRGRAGEGLFTTS
jgi:phosphoglycolate phosphatase